MNSNQKDFSFAKIFIENEIGQILVIQDQTQPALEVLFNPVYGGLRRVRIEYSYEVSGHDECYETFVRADKKWALEIVRDTMAKDKGRDKKRAEEASMNRCL